MDITVYNVYPNDKLNKGGRIEEFLEENVRLKKREI